MSNETYIVNQLEMDRGNIDYWEDQYKVGRRGKYEFRVAIV